MKSIEKAPEDIQKAMENIRDCITATDGGISLVNLLNLINNFSDKLNDPKQANAAQQVLNVIRQFSKIIDAANMISNGPVK